MYESSKDNIDNYVCGLRQYICMWIFKVGRLSILIFGRLHVYYMYVDFLSWRVEYIDIWQVLSKKKLAGSIRVCVDH